MSQHGKPAYSDEPPIVVVQVVVAISPRVADIIIEPGHEPQAAESSLSTFIAFTAASFLLQLYFIATCVAIVERRVVPS